MIIIVN